MLEAGTWKPTMRLRLTKPMYDPDVDCVVKILEQAWISDNGDIKWIEVTEGEK